MVERECETCGQAFTAYPYSVRNGHARFCTRACWYTANTQALAERLDELSMPEPNSGCTLFTGYITTKGYGSLKVNGKDARAHRVAYELVHGPIPNGLVPDHLCRNRACVNERHLELVTPRENVLRGVGLSAQNARSAECKSGHPFDAANTYFSRRGENVRRHCRMCGRLRMQTRRAKEESSDIHPVMQPGHKPVHTVEGN